MSYLVPAYYRLTIPEIQRLFRELCYQIEALGETAILKDPKGEFRDEFYDEARGDIILDPTDQRCPYWALEREARDEAEATPWAEAFWPDEPMSYTFFKKHVRLQFAYLISRYSSFNEKKEPATCANLARWLAKPEAMVAPLLKGSEHAVSVSSNAKEQAQAHWSHLGEIAKPLRMMLATADGRREFCVREWSEHRRGWIFLASTPTTVDAILPLHSAILDMLILHNQAPLEEGERGAPRVWFLLDELATFQRLPQLEAGMTKQRASGNPIVLGVHDMAQLESRYGEKSARTIMSQPYAKIFLRVGNDTEGQQVERMIGHQEVERVIENRPVHMMASHRRSRSWSSQIVDRPVVTAAEVQGLPRFIGYFLQSGLCVKIKIRELKRRVRTHREERLIPQMVAEQRGEPELPVRNEPVPVNDEAKAHGSNPMLVGRGGGWKR